MQPLPKLGEKQWDEETGDVFAFTGNEWTYIGNHHDKSVNELSLAAKLGRGMMDIGQGIKQGYLWAGDALTDDDSSDFDERFKDYTKEVDSEIDVYEKGRAAAGEDGIDWGRIGGQAVATLPVGLGKTAATITGQAAKTGMQGLLAGSSVYTKGGDLGDKAIQAGFGAAGGAASPFVLKGAGKVAGSTFNKLRNLTNSTRSVLPGMSGKVQMALTNEGVDYLSLPAKMRKGLVSAAKEQIAAHGKLDTKALVRKANFDELGFKGESAATASQLTRNPKSWGRERNLEKLQNIGDDLSVKYGAQDEQFNKLGSELISKTKGTTADIGDTNESIIGAFRSKWRDTQKEVSKVYTDITKKHGNIETDIAGLNKFLDANDWDETAKPVVSSISNLLKKNGIINDDGFTGKLLPLKQAESIRKLINKKFVNSKDPNISRLGSEAIDSLDDSVVDSVGDDVFKVARDKARVRFNDFKSKVGKTMDKITGETLSEEDAFKSVSKSKLEELTAIKDNLTGKAIPDESGQGVAAWNNIKKQTMEDLWSKSTNGYQQPFSGITFKKELDKIGRKKLNVLFDGDTDKLYKIAKAGIDMTYAPKRAPVNYSNTAPTLLNYFDDTGVLGALKSAGKRGGLKAEADFYLSGSPTSKPLAKEAIDNNINSVLNGTLKNINPNLPNIGMQNIGLPIGLMSGQYIKDKKSSFLK